jgi:hypothetical protein
MRRLGFSREASRTTASWLVAIVVCGLAIACGPPLSSASTGATEESRAAIRGGTADLEHAAVMALARIDVLRGGDTAGTCTGTTIATGAASGFLVTAAHCVADVRVGSDGTPSFQALQPSALAVLSGEDWLVSYDARRIFPVVDVAIHPEYDGAVRSEVDVAVVRYVGVPADQAVIPLISPEEDRLDVGTAVTLVGYGDTDGTGLNTTRQRIEKQVVGATPTEIMYDQSDGTGTCAGDSGGPMLFASPNGDRVAAVTTFGDAGCGAFGVAVRASAAVTLAQELIARVPATPSCEECRLTSVAPDRACAALNADCETAYGPCGEFLACVDLCSDQTCADGCRRQLSAGALAKQALDDCQCRGSCTDVCAADAACQAPAALPPPPTGGGGPLQCGLAGGEPISGTPATTVVALYSVLRWRRRRAPARPRRWVTGLRK